jgi:hypothetical protein
MSFLTRYAAKTLVMLACALAAGCGSPTSQPTTQNPPVPAATPSASPPAASGPRRLALLVGIDKYKHLPQLQGTQNDVALMKTVLEAYGFLPENIHILREDQATQKAILSEIDDFLGSAGPGDVVVFHFSGHGGRMRNSRDPQGADNTIVPVDSRDWQKQAWDIRDKELSARFSKISTQVGERGSVTVILDSCHSGTALRGEGAVRSAELDERFGDNPPPYDIPVAGATTRNDAQSGFGTMSMRYTLIAGSLSDEKAFERKTPAGSYGALTSYLAQELLAPARGPRTHRDVMDKVVRLVRAEFKNQTPQLEGTEFNRVVFGAETIPVRDYVSADPLASGQVQIDAGIIHGVTAGSEFDIYRPDAHAFALPEMPLARMVVGAVEPTVARGSVPQGTRIPPASKAIERRHNFETQRLRVRYHGLSQSSLLRQVKQRLDAHPDRPFVAAGATEAFDLRLVQERGQIRIYGADNLRLPAPIDVDEATAADEVEERMLEWVRWFAVQRLVNPVSTLNVAFHLTPANAAAPATGVTAYTPGDGRFALEVVNNSDRGVFVYVVNLNSVGESPLVFPAENQQMRVPAGGRRPLPDGTLGLPQDTSFVRDMLKLIATTTEVKPRFLGVSPERGTRADDLVPLPSDPLTRLLFHSLSGTRDGDLRGPIDWTTAEVVYDVCESLNPKGRCSQLAATIDQPSQ